jgi:hypothetical protein
MDHRWQLETSYVLGRGEGNVGNAFNDSNIGDYTNPNTLVNRFGDLPLGPRHQFKTQGVLRLPRDVLVSGYVQALGGIPWTDTISGSAMVKGAATVRFLKTANPQIQAETFIDVAAEPAGTRKFDAQTRVDLRLEKRFAAGLGAISGIVDVFNVLDAGTITRVRDLRLDNANFGLPAQLQLPRQVRLAVRWTF